jgi:hypothetical protein
MSQQGSLFLLEWFQELAKRLSRVRVCCGDWSRVTGPSVTHGMGLTGVFLRLTPTRLVVRRSCITMTILGLPMKLLNGLPKKVQTQRCA